MPTCESYVGAGLLFMLKLVLEGSVERDRNNETLPSLLDGLQNDGIQLKQIHYFAYEPNKELESACVEELQRLGFNLQSREETDELSFAVHNDRSEELVFVSGLQSATATTTQ
jgi:hypothetical protein